MALCAEEPGSGSNWAEDAGVAVTCRACLARLERLGGAAHGGSGLRAPMLQGPAAPG
jgi:hypothetical protein